MGWGRRDFALRSRDDLASSSVSCRCRSFIFLAKPAAHGGCYVVRRGGIVDPCRMLMRRAACLIAQAAGCVGMHTGASEGR